MRVSTFQTCRTEWHAHVDVATIREVKLIFKMTHRSAFSMSSTLLFT